MKNRENIIAPIFGLVVGILVSSLLLIMWGSSPLKAFEGLYIGSFGTLGAISNTLIKAIPLIIGGLAVIISYKSGIFNVGVEGQLFFGAMGGAVIATLPMFQDLPPFISIPLSIVVAMMFGAILGFIPGYLKAYRGINEVVVTMLLNYIIIFFLSQQVQPGGFLHEPGVTANQSAYIHEGMKLPLLFSGVLTKVHIGLIIAIVLVVIVWFVMSRSSIGFKMKAIGLNPKAAQYAGMNMNFIQTNVMIVSGAMAGLAGAIELLGYHYRLVENFSLGIGYNAIAVALLANLSPIGVVLSAIFFGALQAGSITMQIVADVPESFTKLVQGIVVFFVIAGAVLPKIINKKLTMNRLAKEALEANQLEEGQEDA
ncbi:MAG: ABC transporter permease [Firmicutes bacterium]|nr:ABC transporter permease [Bacillota bacterium]